MAFQRVQHADGGLVVRADDRARQCRVPGEQVVDDPRAAPRGVVALPLRPVQELRPRVRHFGGERAETGDAVRAVDVAPDVADRAVTVVVQQVPGQVPHAGRVVTAHVGGRRRGHPGHRDHRDLAGQPFELVGFQHPVVQDDPVALAGQRQDAATRVVLVQVDRADQDVETAALRRLRDTPVDHVGELQAVFLVGEQVLGVPGRPGEPDDDPGDFLQPHAQCPRRAVWDEAQLGHGLQHAVPGLRPRVAPPVEHPRHRCDRYPRRPGHVIDRRHRTRRQPRRGTVIWAVCRSGVGRLPVRGWAVCRSGVGRPAGSGPTSPFPVSASVSPFAVISTTMPPSAVPAAQASRAADSAGPAVLASPPFPENPPFSTGSSFSAEAALSVGPLGLALVATGCSLVVASG